MILIFTNKQDIHADEAIRKFSSNNIDVFRLNTEDLLLKYKINIFNTNGIWDGTICDEVGRELNLSKLKVAWFRKPKFDFLLLRELEKDDYNFVSSEGKAFINILYSLPNITWVNNPFVAERCKSKFQQLLLAQKLGVRTPKTLITTVPQQAREFFIACGNKQILIKTIYTGNVTINGISQGIPARLINKYEFDNFCDSIALTPTQFQEYIPKAFELRVTVIGKQIFAVRIDSQKNEKTKIDWRLYTHLNPHSVFTLPPKIESFCFNFLKEQQLIYGAMDFIVTPNNDYVFLENNPFGQYLWLETETGIPLTETMCNLLAELGDC